MDDLYSKKLHCRLCEKTFSSMMVRRSKQAVKKTDSDFCPHYEGEPPYFYHVYVCPACGYAFLESFRKPPSRLREKISPLPDFFSGRRDAPTARLAYRRAIECAALQEEDSTVLASLYLQQAWICRLQGDQKAEEAALKEALVHYRHTYDSSDLADISRTSFLIGELNRRLGNTGEALNWFSRVATDESYPRAARRLAREAWQALRR